MGSLCYNMAWGVVVALAKSIALYAVCATTSDKEDSNFLQLNLRFPDTPYNFEVMCL